MERETGRVFVPRKAQASVVRASSIIRAREINLDFDKPPGNNLTFFGTKILTPF
jgi:hypothetical protein